MDNKIVFFVDTKKEKKNIQSKVKFSSIYTKKIHLTDYIQNSRGSASKYIFYKTLEAMESHCCQLKKMST